MLKKIVYILLLCQFSIFAIELDLENSDYNSSYLVRKLPKDVIKAVTEPEFLPLKEATAQGKLTYLSDQDWLVYVYHNKVGKLYPLKILIWHEVVNDWFDTQPLCVSYCILTGSAVVFSSNVEGRKRTFAISGYLYMSNLVMYDHQTGSLWSQLDLTAHSGQEKGARLKALEFTLIRYETALNLMGSVPVLLGDKNLPQFQQMYSRLPFSGLENYDRSDDIRSAVPPVCLTDKKYPIKTLFVYFPETNQAVPVTTDLASKYAPYIEYLFFKDYIYLLTARHRPFIILYWFALQAFYPQAHIL